MWRLELKGRTGEPGAARGEVLTYHHELELRRDAAGEGIPIRYNNMLQHTICTASLNSCS